MNIKTGLLFCLLVLIVIGCILVAGCTSTSQNTTVKNDALNIIGISEDGVYRFLGIPYAEPPVGDLRFAPPVAKKLWTETLDCTQYRNASIQTGLLIGDDFPVSEDCLYLNIWKPSNAKEGDNLPVYFWIHGGGFSYGTGSEALYDGTQFAKDDIIVVTINYRLSTLGFLTLQTLMDEYGTTGNWALLDQIMALNWVRDNIAKFGGNPNDVTIGGESAGSFLTFSLLQSPKAEGLFQKAILQSGAISYCAANQLDLNKSLEIGKKVAAFFGADDSPEGLEILRTVNPMELWQLDEGNFQDQMTGSPYSCYQPYDGSLLPIEGPYPTLINGNYNKNITVLIGNNRMEGMAFINTTTLTQQGFDDFIKRVYREDSYQEVIDYYAAQTNRSLESKTVELLGQSLINLGTIAAEEAMAEDGVPIYVYEFNYTDSYGTVPYHTAEVVYPFRQDILTSGQPMQEEDMKVRDTMHAYWVNFIKTGNPNGPGLTNWPQFNKQTRSIMEISSTTQLIDRSYAEINDFLAPRYFR